MLGEIIDVCADENFVIAEPPNQSGGATENLDALVNNRASAAFLHSDVIYAAAQADPSYRQLKTLVALYPEEIHVLALRTSNIKSGGTLGFGSHAVQFNTLADLTNYKVGAAGGGVITAKILTGQGEGHFSVVPFDNGKEVIAALNSGQIQAAVFVGGSPLPNLTSLSGDTYKLLPIPESMASKLSGIYKPAVINYANLKSGAVHTMAPEAIILTRHYTIAKMIMPQEKFRSCFYKHLDELKETPGKHPKWQMVDASNHGTWEWLELPSITTPTSKK